MSFRSEINHNLFCHKTLTACETSEAAKMLMMAKAEERKTKPDSRVERRSGERPCTLDGSALAWQPAKVHRKGLARSSLSSGPLRVKVDVFCFPFQPVLRIIDISNLDKGH